MFVTATVFLINRFRDNTELENRSFSQVTEAPSETLAVNSYTGFYTEELQTLLEQHFETDFSNPGVLFTALKDPAIYDRLIRINYLRNLTMDLGLNLEQVEKYGLVPLRNGSFEINNQLHPGWLTLDAMFSNLLSVDYVENYLTPILLQRGTDQENLDTLNSYLINSDLQLSLSRTTLNVLDDEIHKIESFRIENENREIYTLLSNHINELANHASSLILKEWAIGLVKQLDLPSQEILFQTLSEDLGISKLNPSPFKNPVDGLIREVSSGQLRNEYRNLINGRSQTKERLK